MSERPSPDHLQAVVDTATCLFDRAAVDTALDGLAGQVTAVLEDSNPVLLCVMTGGFIMASELALRCKFPMEIDYLQVSRYGRATSGGDLQWRVRPLLELAGRHVLLVDDILDEGYTLRETMAWCGKQGAASVRSAVLADKQHGRKCDPGFRADFTALQTADCYLFGYGMDYRGYLRNAAGIYAVAEDLL